MDNQKIILFFALSFVLLLIWQAWQQDYGPDSPATTAQTTPSPTADIPATPAAPVASAAAPEAGVPAAAAVAPARGFQRGARVRVVTDLLDVELDTTGGDLRTVALLAYPVSTQKKDEPFRLMQDEGSRIFIAQSGLISQQSAPDHYALYTAESNDYRLQGDELRVPLRWSGADGITVTKTYVFHRDSYQIGIEYRIENASGAPWTGYQYRQFQRSLPGDDEKTAFLYTYTGGVIHSQQEKYEKIKFEDMDKENLDRTITGGWEAMIQHYFIGAWLPDPQETNQFYSKAPKGQPYVLGLLSQPMTVAPGEAGEFKSRLYVGPKDQARMEKAAEGLRLTVDYGVLTILAQPLFWLMKYIHGVVGNWGWSIILLTLMVKLVFYKLSETSYRSMANMRVLQPKLVQLRERYGDDRQRMSQAMMELYKKEKINPLGGCLPMLVQIPVFIALYWVLLESVELRQAPFVLWIHDLSTKDPYYILPLLMGATMFIQQKLNPPPPDPIQAKVLMALPFIFTLFFAFFPAGLVLYWVANSVLSILQQWNITRRIEKSGKPAKA
ncbi:MAG: membrane protein insertase YidC [Gammaproteobacteria bacterium]|nr:membrane protein insertase YidC [Gammaproteobacteria bacterium]